MRPIPPIPSRRLSLAWCEMTARCDHPRRVHLSAGNDDGSPVVVDGVAYRVDITAHTETADDPLHRRKLPLAGPWYVLAADADLAVSHPSGVTAPDCYQREFIDLALPELAGWITTKAASALVAEGAAHWREQCKGWLDNAVTDLHRSRLRLARIAAAIDAGQLPTSEDEHYLRHARVHPR